MEKVCSKCKLLKEISNFYEKSAKSRDNKYFRTPSWYSSQCKECLKAKQIQWRANNPESAKNVDLKQNFGITLEDYNFMFGVQNGRCAICNTHQSELNRALAVDHCHRSDDIRGLLCQNCNHGLGNFKDNPDLLREAIEYLSPRIKKPEVAEQNTTVTDIMSVKKGG